MTNRRTTTIQLPNVRVGWQQVHPDLVPKVEISMWVRVPFNFPEEESLELHEWLVPGHHDHRAHVLRYLWGALTGTPNVVEGRIGIVQLPRQRPVQ